MDLIVWIISFMVIALVFSVVVMPMIGRKVPEKKKGPWSEENVYIYHAFANKKNGVKCKHEYKLAYGLWYRCVGCGKMVHLTYLTKNNIPYRV